LQKEDGKRIYKESRGSLRDFNYNNQGWQPVAAKK